MTLALRKFNFFLNTPKVSELVKSVKNKCDSIKIKSINSKLLMYYIYI